MSEVVRARHHALPEVLTPKDVQEILGIGRRQTYELLADPPFHVVRIGRLFKIPKDPFYKWLNGKTD